MSCFQFIAAEKVTYPIALMCDLLGVSRSGFHAWQVRPPSQRELADAFLTATIRQVHADSDGTYGAPRVRAELREAAGIRVGRKRVARLMAAIGLQGVPVPPRTRTTVRLPGLRVAPDLVARDFNADAPNETWAADITYIRTWEGWLYLAHVLDLYSRLVVGWSMREDLGVQLVVDALEMGLRRRRPSPGLIHHSDQGSQPGFNRSSQRCVGEMTVPVAPAVCQAWRMRSEV